MVRYNRPDLLDACQFARLVIGRCATKMTPDIPYNTVSTHIPIMNILSMGGSAVFVVAILSQPMALAVVQCVYLTAGRRRTPEAYPNGISCSQRPILRVYAASWNAICGDANVADIHIMMYRGITPVDQMRQDIRNLPKNRWPIFTQHCAHHEDQDSMLSLCLNAKYTEKSFVIAPVLDSIIKVCKIISAIFSISRSAELISPYPNFLLWNKI